MTTTPEQTESAENAKFEPVQGGVVIWDSISHMMKETAEQAARDMLERMGIENAQSFTAGDVVELANLIAASKKATPAPAWEPLTPERMGKLHEEPFGTKYWLASKEHQLGPVIGAIYLDAGGVYFSGSDEYYAPKHYPLGEISHIMPLITPEMPKA